jgi:penicillin-binding protein 1B
MAVGLLVYARHIEGIVVEKFNGRRWNLPSSVYSDPFLIYPGVDVVAAGLFDRLQRLNYREVNDETLRKGDYRRTASGLDLFLHDFSFPEKEVPGRLIRLNLAGNVLTRIEDRESGKELFSLQLEPEMITGFYADVWEERQVVTLDALPPLLLRAVITTEDQRFYQHRGIDPIGIMRALVTDLRHGHVVQGGSTLTQQLMKNFFLSEERTVQRKLQEALMALVAERRFSKKEILENYFNEIYLGQNGLQGIFGVWEASQFYFARAPQELSTAEIAMLAGLIKAPNRYSPFRDPEVAKARRNLVLDLMLEAGDITAEQHAKAVAEPLRTVAIHGQRNAAPYFVDFLRQELEQDYPPEVLTSEGLRIFTSLDLQLQRAAERAVREGLDDLERRFPRLAKKEGADRLEACLVAIRPQTGEVRAMVGGRSYGATQFNRVVQARRQPGSVFKPFVYVTAFEQTRKAADPIAPTTPLEDAPFEWPYDSRVWRPQNYRDHYFGNVTVRRALENSLNAATARLAHQVGIEPIRSLAQRMGITSPLPPYPSMVLGALEVSPFEIARAYAVLANQGLDAAPRATRKVLDATGKAIEHRAVKLGRVLSPQAAYLTTALMQGVLDRGTARAARERGFARAAAGKTGTTNEGNDAWFAGFTPDLLAVVWVGFDRREPLGLTGAQAALPIWTSFMKEATAGTPESSFPVPPGIALRRIDPYTGELATPNCPESMEEAFWKGHEPTTTCSLHGSRGLLPWLSQDVPSTPEQPATP